MASDDDSPSPIRIAVAWSTSPGRAEEQELELAAGATVADALRALAAVLGDVPPHLLSDAVDLGIWGRACRTDTLLRAGDRVELYRPLAMSAGEARRRRAAGRGPPQP